MYIVQSLNIDRSTHFVPSVIELTKILFLTKDINIVILKVKLDFEVIRVSEQSARCFVNGTKDM